ncbi:MAG: AAA family ATPase, partial [Spirosomataceae bacterium]
MISHIEIEGFKSIKKLSLELRPINILIGSNGVGKSNFVSFFKLTNALFNQRLQRYVAEEKVDNILYFGRKHTEFLFGRLDFKQGTNSYVFCLNRANDGDLFVALEGFGKNVSLKPQLGNYKYGVGLSESIISNNDSRELNVAGLFSKVKIYHFHDTSPTSFLRRECDLEDNLYFKQDGRNLPAFLYFLKVKHLKIYERIVKMVQSVAPYIDSFILEPSRLNEREIALRWVDSGDLESSFSAYQLSDGTLRFIALTTLLMQPAPPSVIIIDEPELGLHPFAIGKLAGMIQGVSEKAQVIVATQSPGLLSHFEPEDVIVMDRSEEEKQTVFKRLDSHELADWLNDYSLGDLWERNILNAAQPFPQVQ